MTTIQASLPDNLVRDARALVDEGWADDFDGVLAEALRRYLNTHAPQIAEQHVREDIEWGLRGSE
jgi:hypothetical protein